jgi:hypothetical protein
LLAIAPGSRSTEAVVCMPGKPHVILPWDQSAVDATVEVKGSLTQAGLIISENHTAIAGHAIAGDCTLVTNNVREFSRVRSHGREQRLFVRLAGDRFGFGNGFVAENFMWASIRTSVTEMCRRLAIRSRAASIAATVRMISC